MKFGHPDHPRFITEALRTVAEDARTEEANYRHQTEVYAYLAEACALIASRMDIAASVTDPARASTLDAGIGPTVMASAIEEFRAKADECKAAGAHKAFDLYSDAVFVLESAYERAHNGIAHTNGRLP